MERCLQCDIPLGAWPCPNPLCPELHGQSTGALCAWCRHKQAESWGSIVAMDADKEERLCPGDGRRGRRMRLYASAG
jgi:hypothetical protein